MRSVTANVRDRHQHGSAGALDSSDGGGGNGGGGGSGG
eukprot:CAMPEP_0197608046 /NCGR_PEP_ID=MMETSP1326-20131121/48287_1 /TAXON_ID=1155430 /ORGANISM="Genus nov. species nov., Strain RCC2288" /LENGTH=37 /DNA_ID= /DNA_START= /DNA_END= /DNA_ORIENTATION=